MTEPLVVLRNGDEVGREDPRFPRERPGDLARAEVYWKGALVGIRGSSMSMSFPSP